MSVTYSSSKYSLLLLSILVLVVLSEASRFPKGMNWQQMMPKKLPTPSSAPSKGTNVVTAVYTTNVESEKTLPSSDGKV